MYGDRSPLWNVGVRGIDHDLSHRNGLVKEINLLVDDASTVRYQGPRNGQCAVSFLRIDNLGMDIVASDDLAICLVLHQHNPINGSGIVEFQ